jgi:hypothetical protein
LPGITAGAAGGIELCRVGQAVLAPAGPRRKRDEWHDCDIPVEIKTPLTVYFV